MKIKGLFDFVNSSPTAFHTVQSIKDRLLKEGYTELDAVSETVLVNGGKYFTVSGGTSIIAFRYKAEASGFMICASHSDSPAFRLKMNAELSGAYTRLSTEKYGGMIYYSWLDRPLSLAGRVVVNTESGVRSVLVDLSDPILSIPSVAIHLRRNVNDGVALSPLNDMIPLFSTSKDARILKLIADKIGVSESDILSHDLFVYNADKPLSFGSSGEFILAPRLDDLGCVYTSLEAFLSASESESIPVLAVFDNEEVGSMTKQGAMSTFLELALERIAGEKLRAMLNNSFMVSADNAHAMHPNHPELSDAKCAPILNGGVVIKYNASQKYATDGLSSAIFEKICKNAGVPLQYYYNRADIPGGSTLGSIANTKVSIQTVDIGLPELGMHSANETAGREDIGYMTDALREFYSSSLTCNGDLFTIAKGK